MQLAKARNDQATRTEVGFAVRIIVFSSAISMVISSCRAGKLRIQHRLGADAGWTQDAGRD